MYMPFEMHKFDCASCLKYRWDFANEAHSPAIVTLFKSLAFDELHDNSFVTLVGYDSDSFENEVVFAHESTRVRFPR